MNQPKRNKQFDILPLLVIAVGLVLVVGVITWLLLERGRASNANTTQTGAQTSAPVSEQDIQRVSLADSKAAFDNRSAVFVDVRDPDSYKTAHVPGAINIPLGELENRINELKPDQWIILYCT